MKKNGRNLASSMAKMVVGSYPKHWSCMPSRTVNSRNVDAFLRFIDGIGALDLIASVKPTWSEAWYDKDDTSMKEVEILYDNLDNMRVRLFIKMEDVGNDVIPVQANMEIEKKQNGLRHNYVSIDAMAIYRITHVIKERSAMLSLQKEVKELHKQVLGTTTGKKNRRRKNRNYREVG